VAGEKGPAPNEAIRLAPNEAKELCRCAERSQFPGADRSHFVAPNEAGGAKRSQWQDG
jgi:hypothetical protein